MLHFRGATRWNQNLTCPILSLFLYHHSNRDASNGLLQFSYSCVVQSPLYAKQLGALFSLLKCVHWQVAGHSRRVRWFGSKLLSLIQVPTCGKKSPPHEFSTLLRRQRHGSLPTYWVENNKYLKPTT